MKYITVKEAAKKWNIAVRSVQNYCVNNKIPGAKNIGKQWMIPASAEKPADGRIKAIKNHPEISTYHFPLFVHSSYFTNKGELSDDEIKLYDAEILYLTGDLVNCILICRQLQSESISQSVIFGSNCVLGYASMLLGLYTDYQNSIFCMERIIKAETIHKEDYKLLLIGLQAHSTRNFTLVSDINPDKLSFDALYYYRYLLMMSSLVNLTVESNNTVNSFLSLLREVEIQGITPTALCVNCIISFLYKRLGDKNKQKNYMQNACDIYVQTQYNSLFTKYYLIQPALIDGCLSIYNNDYITNLKNIQGDTMMRWLVIHKIASGFAPLPDFTIEQNEILVLMPGSVPLESIARIKNIPLQKVEEVVNDILKISGVESIDKLTKYARERFLEMPKDI